METLSSPPRLRDFENLFPSGFDDAKPQQVLTHYGNKQVLTGLSTHLLYPRNMPGENEVEKDCTEKSRNKGTKIIMRKAKERPPVISDKNKKRNAGSERRKSNKMLLTKTSAKNPEPKILISECLDRDTRTGSQEKCSTLHQLEMQRQEIQRIWEGTPHEKSSWSSSMLPDCYTWHHEREMPDARFEIQFFRTEQCPYLNECPLKESGYCDRVHHPSQKRRCPVLPNGQLRYSPVRCEYMYGVSPSKNDEGPQRVSPPIKSDQCPNGDKCVFSHTAAEVSYHPFLYRTKMCPSSNCKDMVCSFAHARKEIRDGLLSCGGDRFYKTRLCGSFPDTCTKPNCLLAHSRAEVRSILLTEEEEGYMDNDDIEPAKLRDFLVYRFKTLHCPLVKPHDWQVCPYAHNVQDIRRNPLVFKYSADPCEAWKSDMDGCPMRLQCNKSHGPKENLYHPDYFRTKICSDFRKSGECSRGRVCAYLHSSGGSEIFVSTMTTMTEIMYDSGCIHSTADEMESTSLPVQKADESYGIVEEKLRRLFFRFDTDQDGVLSKDKELRQFVEAISGEAPFSNEEYDFFCKELESAVTMEKPAVGLTFREFLLSYKGFGIDVANRDYNTIFC